ncbi:MAG: hypothetical protein AAF399_04445 [Bacteroidota bacterium]
MNWDTFQQSLEDSSPPSALTSALQALWWDAQEDWDQAHDLAQEDHSQAGSWVHAYLHRKEGDTWNADYWYRKAGKIRPKVSLREEWQQMVQQLLQLA